MRSPLRLSLPLGLVMVAPLLLGAQGDGCAAGSKSPAPDVAGAWNITYADNLDVDITIGGQVFHQTLGQNGGTVDITYQGIPITFDLDCSRPEIVCPSEGWPAQVSITQQNTTYEHQMVVTIPQQSCSGPTTAPDPKSCGAGTLNPDCKPVCDGELTVKDTQAFGVIGESGDSFRLYLGGGIATNGLNCALLGYSVADADLTTDGQGTAAWQATAMTSGEVTVGYAGGCLWTNVDATMDDTIKTAIVSADVKFTTSFTGARVD